MKAGFGNDREGPRRPPQLVFRLRPAPVLATCCDPQQQPAGARGLPALARVAARENRRPRQQIADCGWDGVGESAAQQFTMTPRLLSTSLPEGG